MVNEETEPSTIVENLNLEELVRKEIKSLFDAQPNNDPLYQVYDAIDRAITSKFKVLINETDLIKIDILRITEFFNTFHFFESINDFVRDAYVNSNNLRHGFLTNGVLFRTEKTNNKDQIEFAVGYTITELTQLRSTKPELYKSIVNEVKSQLEGFIATDSEEKWYFWPGCEMKIPKQTNIILDTSISKSKFVIVEKTDSIEDKAQIVVEEKPYQLELSILMDTDFYYKKNEKNKQKLKSGFFTINKADTENYASLDFSEIELELQKGEKKYEYTLYVPYASPRLDVKTNMKIFGADAIVEEFIATCT
ncbi:hypothetical protein AWE51_10610 [Aquimarina aggregata]|uniref:Uncharacterized protein n=1 Tax=Aquimarina aggregata TaxID=1642818 RepID=A0A162Y9P0_9FLAO|nr:hypothetical protein [Aquimarina aggregata]KZS39010.1 hypothetical protein AWE51_10610 [Aquimarina aggregata]